MWQLWENMYRQQANKGLSRIELATRNTNKTSQGLTLVNDKISPAKSNSSQASSGAGSTRFSGSGKNSPSRMTASGEENALAKELGYCTVSSKATDKNANKTETKSSKNLDP